MDDLSFLTRLLCETDYRDGLAVDAVCNELFNRRIVARAVSDLLDELERLEKRLEGRTGLDIPFNVLTWLKSLHNEESEQ